MTAPSPLSADSLERRAREGSRLRRAALCAAATAVLLFGPTATSPAPGQPLPDVLMVRAPEAGPATAGSIHVDRAGGRILAARYDAAAARGAPSGLARLLIYDLESRERLIAVSIPGAGAPVPA